MVDRNLLSDRLFAKAVSGMIQRSERQPDLAVLEATFVDTGVMAQLENDNNQILYGRRGTGKSHVLRVLGARVDRSPGRAHVYIDIRLLGSAQLMTDVSQPLVVRCVGLFKDLVGAIQNQLLDLATDPEFEAPGNALEAVSELGEAISAVAQAVASRDVEQESETSKTSSSGVSATLSPSGPKIAVDLADGTTEGIRVKENYHQVFRDTAVFAEVASRLETALTALGIERLLVLIDEWTAIPADVQPYVAEFLKRTLLPSRRTTLKIASLEYRSNFSIPLEQNNLLGFELGGDIAANLDLDDYYVYERTPDQVIEAFLELLFRHVVAELPEDYLKDDYGIASSAALRARLFTEPATFLELVRAGEGVVRDFLGVFSSSYFRAGRQGKKKIDLNSVEEAARDWYETDKSTNLSRAQEDVLQRIITDVIGTRRARSFLLERVHASHPTIQSLFDLRLLHLMRRGYSDKENPGLRYNIYSLDYGTYVDLKRTQSQPELDMLVVDDATEERIVPFDDKRSIRRIILDPVILETEQSGGSEN